MVQRLPVLTPNSRLLSCCIRGRIHSDSWGSGSSSYDLSAQQVDLFLWDHPDMLSVFAAGNEGFVQGTSVQAPLERPALSQNGKTGLWAGDSPVSACQPEKGGASLEEEGHTNSCISAACVNVGPHVCGGSALVDSPGAHRELRVAQPSHLLRAGAAAAAAPGRGVNGTARVDSPALSKNAVAVGATQGLTSAPPAQARMLTGDIGGPPPLPQPPDQAPGFDLEHRAVVRGDVGVQSCPTRPQIRMDTYVQIGVPTIWGGNPKCSHCSGRVCSSAFEATYRAEKTGPCTRPLQVGTAFDFEASSPAPLAGRRCRVLQGGSLTGPSFQQLSGLDLPLVPAQPPEGCSSPKSPYNGSIVLVQLGSCLYLTKAIAAQQAGAAAVLIFDDGLTSGGETLGLTSASFLRQHEACRIQPLLPGHLWMPCRLSRAQHPSGQRVQQPSPRPCRLPSTQVGRRLHRRLLVSSRRTHQHG